MVTQRAWRAMFNEFRADQRLAALISRIFETDNVNEKAVLIDELYALNTGKKNSLTGPSANAIYYWKPRFSKSKATTGSDTKSRQLFSYSSCDGDVTMI
jgi:hypothetical protein